MSKPSLVTAALLLLWSQAGCIGTESGNPPLTSEDAIRIESVEGQLEVVGDPGAVSPSDSEVEVANMDMPTARERVAVEADGSFRQRLAGAAEDEVRLVAVRDRLRSRVLALQVVASDPSPSDCVRLSTIEADVAAGAPAMVELVNDCASLADVSAPRLLFGAGGLEVTPGVRATLGADERLELALSIDATPAELTLEVVELEVTVDGATARRRISVFLR